MHVFEDGRRDMEAFYRAREGAAHPSIAAIGSTDFHQFAPVGLGRTYLFARDRHPGSRPRRDPRADATVACDGLGQAYGPAELVEMVAADCRRAATAPPAGAGGRRHHGDVCARGSARSRSCSWARFERGSQILC